MAEVTVKQLAQVVGTPVEKLLDQLREAGVVKSAESDVVSDEEKYALLQHLRNARGQPAAGSAEGSSKKITLRRKRLSPLKSDSSGRKTVNVEVRGRRAVANPGDAPAHNGSSEGEAENAPTGELTHEHASAPLVDDGVNTDSMEAATAETQAISGEISDSDSAVVVEETVDAPDAPADASMVDEAIVTDANAAAEGPEPLS